MNWEGSSLLGGLAEDEDAGSLCPSLTLPQRLVGAAFCVAMGFVLSFGAMGRIILLLKGNPQPFVVFLTFGSILSLASSFFLTGPAKQLRQMFDEKRRIVSTCLIGSMAGTVVVALRRGLPFQAELLLLLMFVQLLSQAYYCLTYVPFGTDVLASACAKISKAACPSRL